MINEGARTETGPSSTPFLGFVSSVQLIVEVFDHEHDHIRTLYGDNFGEFLIVLGCGIVGLVGHDPDDDEWCVVEIAYLSDRPALHFATESAIIFHDGFLLLMGADELVARAHSALHHRGADALSDGLAGLRQGASDTFPGIWTAIRRMDTDGTSVQAIVKYAWYHGILDAPCRGPGRRQAFTCPPAQR